MKIAILEVRKTEKMDNVFMEEQIKKQENHEKNIKILIVDDETDMCWVLSRIFQNEREVY